MESPVHSFRSDANYFKRENVMQFSMIFIQYDALDQRFGILSDDIIGGFPGR